MIYLWSKLNISVAGEKPQRRGSVGSLDSGMSISFQSTSASSMSQGAKGMIPGGHQVVVHATPHPGSTVPNNAVKGMNVAQQPSFLGSLFNKRERKLSHTEDPSITGSTTSTAAAVAAAASVGQTVPYGRTTEV